MKEGVQMRTADRFDYFAEDHESKVAVNGLRPRLT